MNDLRRNWSETKLQAELISRAKDLDWLVQHSRRAPIRRDDGTVRHATPISGHVGYPDLSLARRGRKMFLELKAERGQVSVGYTDDRGRYVTGQLDWLNSLAWTPDATLDDWRSRGEVPDGRAFHPVGGWTPLDQAGDWHELVAVIRPRHYRWIVDQMAQGRY